MTEAGMKPNISAKTNVRIPDLTVTCGPVAGRDDKLVNAPLLTIEVLSPSKDDLTGVSIMACGTIPSLREILVIDSVRMFAELWQRDSHGAWPTEPQGFASGSVKLETIDLTLLLTEIYAGTHLAGI